MNEIYIEAIKNASDTRLSLGYNLHQPLNIYDACDKANLVVQFVDINMEGLYIGKTETPRILLSAQRPLVRKTFTCAHEFGHHIFQHGFKIDIIMDDSLVNTNTEERQADVFSGHFLMPILGVKAEFIKRKLKLENATELDYYLVSCAFGVGYQTLVKHCYFNTLIEKNKYTELLKCTPASIFKKHYNNDEKFAFKIFDEKSLSIPIDIEMESLLILPKSLDVDTSYLEFYCDNESENIFKTKKVGITNVYTDDVGCFVRIQPKNYVGYAEYRNLEN